MPSAALIVTKALIRKAGIVGDDIVADPDLLLEDEPQELRDLVRSHDLHIRDLVEIESEDNELYLDDDEVTARVAERRMAHWTSLISDPEELLEAAVYQIEVGLPAIVEEMVGYFDMVVSRQPALAGPIAERRAQFAAELEEMFGPLMAGAG